MLRDFEWTRGEKRIISVHGDRQLGLRDSWLTAWSANEQAAAYAVIIEDDIVLSPAWFAWVRAALVDEKYFDDDLV